MENLQNQKSNEELVSIPEKYMLTIREAASYFNIGIKNMRRLCESNEGEFSVRWGNKYLIGRPRVSIARWNLKDGGGKSLVGRTEITSGFS